MVVVVVVAMVSVQTVMSIVDPYGTLDPETAPGIRTVAVAPGVQSVGLSVYDGTKPYPVSVLDAWACVSPMTVGTGSGRLRSRLQGQSPDRTKRETRGRSVAMTSPATVFEQTCVRGVLIVRP